MNHKSLQLNRFTNVTPLLRVTSLTSPKIIPLHNGLHKIPYRPPLQNKKNRLNKKSTQLLNIPPNFTK